MNWIHYRFVIHIIFGCVGGIAGAAFFIAFIFSVAFIMDSRGPGNRPKRRHDDDQDNIEEH